MGYDTKQRCEIVPKRHSDAKTNRFHTIINITVGLTIGLIISIMYTTSAYIIVISRMPCIIIDIILSITASMNRKKPQSKVHA